MTQEEFIKRAKEIHGNKYDYSKVKYINKKTKVCIICPKHGEFWQEAASHYRGCGCKMCALEEKANKKRLSKEEFIERARKVHGDKYDYSKVNYINIDTKICIICPKHGEFWQKPLNHLNGSGCKECMKEKFHEERKLTTKEFIKRAKKVHGNKYDYSKVEYINADTKICIIDKDYGEFWMMPYAHLHGQDCPKRKNEKIHKSRVKTLEQFIKEAKEVHGNKYNYSKVDYKDCNTKVCIICPEHGEFWQRPADHLNGCGCPKCRESHLEKEVKIMLQNNGINYEQNFKTKWLGRQHLDFYLPDYNIAIECQGGQHFIPVKKWQGEKGLEIIKKRDLIKNDNCQKNNVKLVYYHHEKIINEGIYKKENQYTNINDLKNYISTLIYNKLNSIE